MRSRTVDLGGEVHYADFGGEGPPTLVLVHGLGGSCVNWMSAGPLLARRARVLAPDLIGFGRTPPAGRSSAVEDQAALIERFLDEVAGAPAILVGNSMGGLLSMMVVGRSPARVAGLVLAAPAQPRSREARFDPAVTATFLLYVIPWIGELYIRRRAARLGPEGVVRAMFELCCPDPSCLGREVLDAHVAHAALRLSSMPWAHASFLAAARSIFRVLSDRARYAEMARRVEAPALIVQGAQDRLVPLASSRELLGVRPDWTLEVLENVGHVPQLEDPARFADVVERWLDRLKTPAPALPSAKS